MSIVVTHGSMRALLTLAAPSPQDEFSDDNVAFDADLKKILEQREAARNQKAKEDLADLIVSLLDSARKVSESTVEAVRSARREEKSALARLDRINRASAYLKATGNAAPLLVILSPTHCRELLAAGATIEVPDSFQLEKKSAPKRAAKSA